MKNNSNITTVLSLFDGISCARVALDRLGYRDILYLASEVDKYAIQIAQKNYPDTIQLGDVCKIQRDMLPQHIDLLIGGSPCQDLSIAKNNRKGLDGERSGLFWEWVRLWRECQPRYWVLENVNSMPKDAKRIISETLGVEPIMINAALVSAQNRKRLFWTNIATDIFGHCHIPLPEDRGILLRDILETGSGIADKSHPINATYWKAGTSPAAQEYSDRTHQRTLVVDNVYPGGGQNGNVYSPGAKSPTLSAGTGIKGRGIGSSNAPKIAEPIRVGDIGTKGQAHRVYSDDGKSVSLSTASGGQGSATGLYAIEEAPNGKRIEIPVAETEPMMLKEVRTEQGKASRREYRVKENRDSTKRSKTDKKYITHTGKGNCITTSLTSEGVVIIPEATKQGYAIAEEGDSVDLSYPNSKTRRGRVSKKAPSQMTSSQSVGVLEGYTIRKLTPIECERLQSLPDNYTEGISNTQRYKTLGNAFNVEVVRHILSNMADKIIKEEQ